MFALATLTCARLARLAALALAALLLGGCADPRASYEDFVERYEMREAGVEDADSGACTPPPPNSISGRALMAVGTTVSPGHPILFLGEVTTPQVDDKTAVLFRYHPLDASDRRTEVGEELELGPFAIEADGTFHADTGEDTLPGEANALLPGVPITSALTLDGTLCGVTDFYCGTVGGYATFPVMGPIDGTFGLELVPEDLPEQPRYGCGEDDLAVPLGTP